MTKFPVFPVTTVGSFPRPTSVQRALRNKQAGRMTEADFEGVCNAAVLECVRLQEESGVDIVTDGELRRDNFYSFIADKVDGVQLMTLAEMLDWVEDKAAFEKLLTALDVPAFAIKNPVVVGAVRRRTPLTLDDFRFLRQHTDKPIKVSLPGPYLLTRSMWVKNLTAAYYPTKEALGADVVRLLRDELLALCDAGCDYVQFDEPVLTELVFADPHAARTFMCAALTERYSPETELSFAIELNNAVVDGVTGCTTCLHVCRGNWSQREEVLLKGGYEALMPHFRRLRVHQLVLEYATERTGGFDALRDFPTDKQLGLGVCNPRTNEVESLEFITGRVQAVQKFIEKERLYLNPDCGFGTFADRPVNTMEIAIKKLTALSQAAKLLREQLA